jgi:hypothetical protein|nr:MAG TPA: hypothetical protein [Caudoviricetes sp.]
MGKVKNKFVLTSPSILSLCYKLNEVINNLKKKLL